MKKLLTLIVTVLAAYTGANAQDNEIFSSTVGEYRVWLLSEGQSQGRTSILIDAGQDILGRYVPDGTFPNAVNAFLVAAPDGKKILFDTGHGRKLFDNLASIGVSPADITEVRLTHMHGDHIGGMFRDGEIAFPSAEVFVGRVERDYWSSEIEMNRVPENGRRSFVNAQRVFGRYSSVLHILDPLPIGDVPDVDGIYPVEAYGHTPGHICFMIVSAGEKLLIWGDLTHAMSVQMPHPEIAVTYDVDPGRAVKSRIHILNYVATHRIPVAGMHIPYPGIGVVEPVAGMGYRFVGAK